MLREIKASARPRECWVLFGHGGAAASFFRTWANRVADDIRLLAVEYPGHGEAAAEPFAPSVRALAEQFAGELTADESLSTVDIVLFGHSLGAAVAFEVATRVKVSRLVVSGRAGAFRAGTGEPADAGEVLRALGMPIPEASRAAAEHDVVIAGRYGGTSRVLDCPITALTGETDPVVTVGEMAGWRAATTGPFALKVFPGGHFFLVAAESEVVEAVAQEPSSFTVARSSTARVGPPARARRVVRAPIVDDPPIDRARLAAGTPLRDGKRITFVWQGKASRVLLLANKLHDRADPERSLMHQVDEDLWALTYELPEDWRGSYQFEVDGQLRLDPANAHAIKGKSVTEPPNALWWPHSTVPQGTLTGNSPLWTYTSAGDPLASLILLDGDMWLDELSLPSIVDTLVAARKIPPLQVVCTAAEDRGAEYTCVDAVADHLAGLSPFSPQQTVIAGQSLGGLAAAHAALRHPKRFRRVFVQSGSFWWGEEELTRRVLAGARSEAEFVVESGTDESSPPDATDRFVAALRDTGHDVTQTRFSGGHDRVCWRARLAEQLPHLFTAID